MAKRGTTFLRFVKIKQKREKSADKEAKKADEKDEVKKEEMIQESPIKPGEVVELNEDMIKDVFYSKYEIERNFS